MLCDLRHPATNVLLNFAPQLPTLGSRVQPLSLLSLTQRFSAHPGEREGGVVIGLDLNPPCHMFIFKSDPAILACLGRSKPWWTWGRGSSNGSHPCALQLFSLWKQRGDQQDQMEPLCHQPASLLAQWRLNRAPTSVVWEEFTWEGRDAPPFNPMWLLNDPFCGGGHQWPVLYSFIPALMHNKVVLR